RGRRRRIRGRHFLFTPGEGARRGLLDTETPGIAGIGSGTRTALGAWRFVRVGRRGFRIARPG
ncbi:MAG TPA: hypothetical protein VIS73_12020, partial [Rhodocyclaceae bacterium]